MANKRMRVFQTVAETNSFTRAAELLHMTQPAVTFQIRRLEEEINMQVFNRGRNTLEITEAGKIALKCAEQIQDAYAKMQEALYELPDAPKPKLWKPETTAEAETFSMKHCSGCANRPKVFGVACGIWRAAEMYSIQDSKYPAEWQYMETGEPVCAAFQAAEQGNIS